MKMARFDWAVSALLVDIANGAGTITRDDGTNSVTVYSRSCKIHPAKLIGVVIGCRDELGIARSKG